MKYLYCMAILLMALLTGCASNESGVGFPGSQFENHITTIPDSCFLVNYAFQDSIKAYGNNTRLDLGEYNGIQSRVLLKSEALPTNLDTTNVTSISTNPTITLRVKRSYNCTSMNIKIYKLTSTWLENKATWNKTSDTTNWVCPGGDFEANESIVALTNLNADSTITFEIPKQWVFDWMKDSDTNHGILLSLPNRSNEIVEFYSGETLYPPTLTFKYMATDNLIKTYDENIYYDTFIHSGVNNFAVYDDQLRITNIIPYGSYLYFTLPPSYFEGVQTTEELKNVTINRAELVLHTKSVDNYKRNDLFGVVPCLLKVDNTSQASLFSTSNYLVSSTSTDSLHADSLTVNVTTIVQNLTSGKKTNYGILLISSSKNANFMDLQFYTKNSAVSSYLKPHLRLYYSVIKN